MRRKLIAGNWKMNGVRTSLSEIARLAELTDRDQRRRHDVLICPPLTLAWTSALAALGTGILIGAQDCHANASGAHTGDVSANMLSDLGLSHVIVGHSERRADHAETSAVVKAKATAALDAGLVAIVCVGETLAEREAGKAEAVVGRQVRASLPDGFDARTTVIAYEPVWAIGTGKTATPADVQAMHSFIRSVVKRMARTEASTIRILYGGSVKPGNAAELLALADVDGALVGGASLVASDFASIVKAAG
jgi:triosephosphate isomerase